MKIIQTITLFPLLDRLLIDLLRSLTPQDWEQPTLAPRWKVKDIAAHLLDGNLRSLSILRDGYYGDPPADIQAYQDLVAYLNRLNADWVKAMRRVSPNLLIDWLEQSGREYVDYLRTLDPLEESLFSVAWAGEEESLNWFHIAREYTEKWHHQQQIRQAVGQEAPLYQKELYFLYLDTSMRALPHHYRDVKAEEGALIKFRVIGGGGGEWQLKHKDQQWVLYENSATHSDCTVEIDEQVAWRIFTKGIGREEATAKINIIGKRELGEPILSMLAVMA